jgi:nucleoside-diphosphate-sugar epimerase
MSDSVVILGLGFTTQRLARRLLARGKTVYAAVRRPERFAEFSALGLRVFPLAPAGLPPGAVLVHSVPPLAEPDNSAIRALIRDIAPRRILYISSTGVYGSQTEVSAASPAAPNDARGRARVDEEQWIAATGAQCLILRSAAIYGPGRGVHARLLEGKTPRRGAEEIVSRIHVDDLAAILAAGIESSIEGVWPVADHTPAATGEVAAWCARFMGIAPPDLTMESYPVRGRSVDGRKITELLGVELKYSSYETGIPASLRSEGTAGGGRHYADSAPK